MAVEAHRLNFFSPQLIGNREIMNTIQGNMGNVYNTVAQSNLGGGVYGTMPIPANIAAAEALAPANNHYFPIADSIHFAGNNNQPKVNPVKKSDSGITTYNNNSNAMNNLQTTAFSRKRSRESANPLMSNLYSSPISSYTPNCGTVNSYSFLGEDISLQINQHQSDIDHLISQHMEKVRIEIEEKRKRQARKILEAIEIGLAKRLRAKEEEIEKIGKLNWALEERVKSLCAENQIWRELAQSNEATANALRTNLEQVLAQVKLNDRENDIVDDENDVVLANNNELADDAQSCCGENDVVSNAVWRSVGGRNDVVSSTGYFNNNNNNNQKRNRLCRSCGKGESCVLLMPCRHLCLCTSCGSSLHTCPICKSTKTASVNVNMS